MTQDELKTLFEAYNNAALQAAVNALGDDPRLEKIYVYTMLGASSIETAWYCQVDGAFMDVEDAGDKLGAEDADNVSLTRECRAERRAFMMAAMKGERPERIITEYDGIRGTMKADWDYDVQQGEDDTAGFARDRWIADHGGETVFSAGR